MKSELKALFKARKMRGLTTYIVAGIRRLRFGGRKRKKQADHRLNVKNEGGRVKKTLNVND